QLSERLPHHRLAPAQTPERYTLSLHDALPISTHAAVHRTGDQQHDQADADRDRAKDAEVGAFTFGRVEPSKRAGKRSAQRDRQRSEEHTSELQSRFDLVCRLLLEKKKVRAPGE